MLYWYILIGRCIIQVNRYGMFFFMSRFCPHTIVSIIRKEPYDWVNAEYGNRIKSPRKKSNHKNPHGKNPPGQKSLRQNPPVRKSPGQNPPVTKSLRQNPPVRLG